MNAMEFLNELYGYCESGYTYLWTKQNGRTHSWYSVTDTENLINTALRLSGEENDVFYGVGLMSQPKAAGKAAADEITSIPGLWFDMDIAHEAHKRTDLPGSMEEAMEVINSIPLEPSIIVNSGHGLHAYWLFREPWDISVEADRRQAADLLKRFQKTIQINAAAKGWKLDSTYNLDRILRLPGTTNYKSDPVPVTVIYKTEHRYNPDDLDGVILAEVETATATEKRTEKFERRPSDGPTALAMDNCAFLQQFYNPQGLTEPEWMAAVTNLARCKGGPEFVHELVKPYLKEKYNEADTNKKILHALNGMHAQTCKYIRDSLGFTGCPQGGCGVKAPSGWALSKKKRKKKESPPPAEFHAMEKLTDLGNAERFARMFGDKLKYCFQFGSWLIWDGQRHKMDETGQVMLFAKKAIRSFYTDAAEIENADVRDSVIKHARKSESHGAISAMIKLAQPMMPVHINELDNDYWLMNVKNGVIDLKTGQLLPHDHNRMITKMAPVEYDPAAECPVFISFLESVFPAGEHVIQFVQRWLGYCLTGDTREQRMAIAWGNGANGKGTLLNLIQDVMGDYAQSTPTDTLMAKKNEGISNDIARLRGARYVLASETKEGRRLNEPLIKQMTGQDRLTARFLHKEFFEFMPQFKLTLLTNHKPVASGDDAALWRRIMLIPFTQKFEGIKRDDTLKERLRDPQEMAGILKWLVKGCLEWQEIGLNPPPEVVNATAEYQSENDIMSIWMDDCCVEGNLITAKTTDLYHNFMEWTQKNGEKVFFSQKKFSASLQNKGYEIFKGGGGIKKVRGIGLLALESELPLEPMESSTQCKPVEPF